MTDIPLANCNGVLHRAEGDMFAVTLGHVEQVPTGWRAEQFCAVMMEREHAMALRDMLTSVLVRTGM